MQAKHTWQRLCKDWIIAVRSVIAAVAVLVSLGTVVSNPGEEGSSVAYTEAVESHWAAIERELAVLNEAGRDRAFWESRVLEGSDAIIGHAERLEALEPPDGRKYDAADRYVERCAELTIEAFTALAEGIGTGRADTLYDAADSIELAASSMEEARRLMR